MSRCLCSLYGVLVLRPYCGCLRGCGTPRRISSTGIPAHLDLLTLQLLAPHMCHTMGMGRSGFDVSVSGPPPTYFEAPGPGPQETKTRGAYSAAKRSPRSAPRPCRQYLWYENPKMGSKLLHAYCDSFASSSADGCAPMVAWGVHSRYPRCPCINGGAWRPR